MSGSERSTASTYLMYWITARRSLTGSSYQAGIAVPGPIKSTFFLLFLFAVGYGVGPQFFRGLSKEGPKQVLFSVIVLALCLIAVASPVLAWRWPLPWFIFPAN